jgi:hypothetical protein
MKNCFLAMFLAVIFSAAAAAQKTNSTQAIELPPQTPIFSPAELAAKVPPAKMDDVKSMDAILHAMYDVISGPAGERDWKRFRSIMLPQARFTQVGKGPDGATFVISWNVDEFVRDAAEVFSKRPFYENAIRNAPSPGREAVRARHQQRAVAQRRKALVGSFHFLGFGAPG